MQMKNKGPPRQLHLHLAQLWPDIATCPYMNPQVNVMLPLLPVEDNG